MKCWFRKFKNLEQDQTNKSHQNYKTKEGNKVLYARFEETNAALDRAFERISTLESENNALVESVACQKGENEKLQNDIEKLTWEHKKLLSNHEKIELERVHTKEHLRVNNEHVDRIKNENKDLERKVKQVTDIKLEMSKILDDERQVYKDSKKLYEEEINGLKSSLSAKVFLLFFDVLGWWKLLFKVKSWTKE